MFWLLVAWKHAFLSRKVCFWELFVLHFVRLDMEFIMQEVTHFLFSQTCLPSTIKEKQVLCFFIRNYVLLSKTNNNRSMAAIAKQTYKQQQAVVQLQQWCLLICKQDPATIIHVNQRDLCTTPSFWMVMEREKMVAIVFWSECQLECWDTTDTCSIDIITKQKFSIM